LKALLAKALRHFLVLRKPHTAQETRTSPFGELLSFSRISWIFDQVKPLKPKLFFPLECHFAKIRKEDTNESAHAQILALTSTRIQERNTDRLSVLAAEFKCLLGSAGRVALAGQGV
jgi:hypothetical protein